MPGRVSAPRSRRPRSSLTIEEILDVAERVAVGGIETLTIRAVATELDSSPMALYRYFNTKDELVDALLNRVLGRMAPPTESASCIEDLGVFARNHPDMLNRHQWAVTALFARPVPGPNALPMGEWALRILDRGGITDDAAVATFSGIIGLNYGWASFEVARPRRRRGFAGRGPREPARRSDLPAHRLGGPAHEPLRQPGALRTGARSTARRDLLRRRPNRVTFDIAIRSKQSLYAGLASRCGVVPHCSVGYLRQIPASYLFPFSRDLAIGAARASSKRH